MHMFYLYLNFITFNLTELCSAEGTKGYPTFYLYHQGKQVEKYQQGRTAEAFLNYINNPPALPKEDKKEEAVKKPQESLNKNPNQDAAGVKTEL